MAKVQLALLSVMGVVTIAIGAMVFHYLPNNNFYILEMAFIFLLLAFELISVINIFHSSKLLKQQNGEKLKKSARLVKFGSIFFWIAVFIIYKEIEVYYTFLFGISLYSVLLGTSVFSIAYIRLLYKEKKLSLGQTIIFTLLQLCFVLDILGLLFLAYSEKSKKPAKEIARFFLGSYKPPEFFGVIADAFKRGPVPIIFKKTGAFFNDQWKKHHIRSCVIIAVLCLIPVGFYACSFYQARKPQPIRILFRVQAPGTTVAPESRSALTVFFQGSAATLEMRDHEVPAGKILINPPIEGVWKWHEDDTLIFSTEQTWRIGKRYTVNFSDDFFPSHIKVESSFRFEIEDFSMKIIESEFYIDPEDSAIKRVLFTVQANYPFDAASLEKNINIEPQINADSGLLKKRPYLFSLTYNEDRTRAYIVSEPLGMPAKTIDMRLSIAAGVTDSSGEGKVAKNQTAQVEIPGMVNFVRVSDMSHQLVKNDQQLYDQVLVMNTQGTIDAAELA
ncbi:MAG: hypothetical protein LBH43_07470, partial [Treponema sp.]|nr:hypothetical protein [Treponema sp.]